jgi:glycosyltransferase involved in cell wall biosynthesis
VLHDLPDTEKIREIRNRSHKSNGIIWVGNSKWGQRYGYKDLKGFQEIVEPLMRDFLVGDASLKFKVFDSSKQRVDNKIILSEIANSRVLIQASESEGTGLPILEALGLGIIPVTTNVGVAAELLTGELAEFIVPRNLAAFRIGINRAIEKGSAHYSTCLELFENYIYQASLERITWTAPKLHIQWTKPTLAGTMKIQLIWLLRRLRNQSTQPKSIRVVTPNQGEVQY